MVILSFFLLFSSLDIRERNKKEVPRLVLVPSALSPQVLASQYLIHWYRRTVKPAHCQDLPWSWRYATPFLSSYLTRRRSRSRACAVPVRTVPVQSILPSRCILLLFPTSNWLGALVSSHCSDLQAAPLTHSQRGPPKLTVLDLPRAFVFFSTRAPLRRRNSVAELPLLRPYHLPRQTATFLCLPRQQGFVFGFKFPCAASANSSSSGFASYEYDWFLPVSLLWRLSLTPSGFSAFLFVVVTKTTLLLSCRQRLHSSSSSSPHSSPILTKTRSETIPHSY